MLPLTLWMNVPSFYQGDLFRALVASGEVDLQVIFARNLGDDRLRLGWGEDVVGYHHCFLDQSSRVSDSTRRAWRRRDSLHIVNGLWAEPAFAAALVTLALAGSKYLIYSEAPNPELARLRSSEMLRAIFGRAITKRAAGALTVSRLAEQFYRSLGLPERILYPFGYFRRGVRHRELRCRSSDQTRTEVLFVGQLIRRKGVDLLLDAMLPLFKEHPELILSFVGVGEMESVLRSNVDKLGLTGCVSFEGATAPEKIPARIAAADLLILPSRWDGWGMVVNEALSVGVPVIVSDRCGAADLIQNGVNGYVFRAEDVTHLRGCLAAFLDARADWPAFRTAALETGEMISAEKAASYLIDCLKHVSGVSNRRPNPPWTQRAVCESAAAPR